MEEETNTDVLNDTPVEENTSAESTEDTAISEETAEKEDSEKEQDSFEEETPQKTLKIKYLDQDIDLNEDEAKDLAEIGKYVKENNALDTVKWLKNQAKEAGFNSVSEYQDAVKNSLSQAQQAQRDAQIEQEALNAVTQNPSLDIEREKEIARVRLENEDLKKFKQSVMADNAKKQADIAEISEFKKEFPNVDIEKIPDEVLAAKKANPNKSYSDLYYKFLYQQKNNVDKVKQKAAQNSKQSTGSLQNNSKDNDKEFIGSLFNIIDRY